MYLAEIDMLRLFRTILDDVNKYGSVSIAKGSKFQDEIEYALAQHVREFKVRTKKRKKLR